MSIITKSIIKRTKSGVDINNQRFKPYSKQYKKKSKRVDLTLTGQMLNSISSNDDQIFMTNQFASNKVA